MAELQHRVGYTWDPARGRYISLWNNRPVKESTILSKMGKYNEGFVKQNLRMHTDKLLAGQIDLPTWQTRMARELKDAHRLNIMVGRGGYAQMTYSDWGKLGSTLREEYKYLNRFAQEIYSGRLSAAQIQARVSLYASKCTTSYHAGVAHAKLIAGFDIERRVLHPAEHCEDCITYAGLGWVPIGSLPLPGEGSRCGANCKCTMEHGKSQEVFSYG